MRVSLSRALIQRGRRTWNGKREGLIDRSGFYLGILFSSKGKQTDLLGASCDTCHLSFVRRRQARNPLARRSTPTTPTPRRISFHVGGLGNSPGFSGREKLLAPRVLRA